MESNFAYNYFDNINKLQEILLQPYIDECKSEFQFTILEGEDILEKIYFIDQQEEPCCKISFSPKGIIFYEKKI